MRSAMSPETSLGWDEFLTNNPYPWEQICWMIAQLTAVYFNRTRTQQEQSKTTDDFMLKWGRRPMPRRQTPDEVRAVLGAIGYAGPG